LVSDEVALDLLSFLVVVVEVAWPKLSMLSRPTMAVNIINLRVIFMRTISSG
jgi:hypothetical protein